jgi:replicative DNA helicase
MIAFLQRVGAMGESRRASASSLLGCIAESGPSNTNLDVIPKQTWPSLVKPAMAEAGMTTRAMQAAIGTQYCGSTLYKANLSRERAARVAEAVGSKELAILAQSDLYWDRIVSIEPDGIEEVYDLTIEDHHNFVADDIVVHNSIEQDADIVSFIYRDEYYNDETERPGEADLVIAKHRNGPIGTIPLAFQAQFPRFLNLAGNYGSDDHGEEAA